jgi:signal-transduction protein with cAMP-binding, CBS, and nucleotidyltransferase domain
MNVGEFASRPAIACAPPTPLVQVARMMQEHNIGAVVVIDDDHHACGIVTDRDLALRGLARGLLPSAPVDEVMSHEVVCVREGVDTLDAARQMATRGCRRLPVVTEGGVVVGMLTADDLLERAGEEVDNVVRALVAGRCRDLHSFREGRSVRRGRG